MLHFKLNISIYVLLIPLRVGRRSKGLKFFMCIKAAQIFPPLRPAGE